ncbi:MAG: helix-turn-helix transcriptional regulator [Eggerthellaceae bacterium]|nr:helix-turn-helix transcriptional regulator [Eggerthellaceae bacterium]
MKRNRSITQLIDARRSLFCMSKAAEYHFDIALDKPIPGELARIVGRNVKRVRLEQRLSKKTLCLMVGIGRPMLNDIEKGCADIRLSYIERLAEGLSVHPYELLFPFQFTATTPRKLLR